MEDKKEINITIGHGKQVHRAIVTGEFTSSLCGSEKCSTGRRWRSGIKTTSLDVTCDKCKNIIASK